MSTYFKLPNQNNPFPRAAIVGALALLGLLSGVVPTLSERSGEVVFDNAAQAQSISQDEIRRYARAIWLMEPIRQTTYNEIKKIVGSVPNVVCHQPDSLNALPRQAQPIAENYCNQYQRIVDNSRLGTARFNAITMSAQSDENLRTRIQNELIRLQRPRR